MGKVIYDGDELEVNDGGSVLEACYNLGIPFGCQDGVCGTCTVTVVSGMENLEEKTDKEKDMVLEDNERLACQCTLRSGSVEFSI